MQNASFTKVVLVYVTIILGVLLWSGSDQEKSIYDRYLVSFKGVEVPVSNLQAAKKFFSEFLQFGIKDETAESMVIILPDNKTIKIIQSRGKEIETVSLKIQVKNGLSQFRELLLRKMSSQEIVNLGISISEVQANDTQNYFSIESPTHIKVIFYHRKFFTKN